jgi:tetratricopeptide (TPR) repeat protein
MRHNPVQRRPNRRRSYTALRAILGRVAHRITLNSVAVTFCTLTLLLIVIRELRREVLIIAPFHVPKRFSDVGLTGSVLADRVGAEITRLELQSHSAMRKDSFASPDDSAASPDIQIPGTKLSSQFITGLLRQALRINPEQIEGSVVLREPLGESTNSSGARLQVVVYVSRGEGAKKEADILLDNENPDTVVAKTAEAVLRIINPYLFACYSFDHFDYATADNVLRGIAQDPLTDQLHRAAVHNRLGIIQHDQGHNAEAISEYQRAIEMMPSYMPPYSNLGGALQDEGKLDQALSYYQKSISRDRHYSLSYVGWGQILVKEGRYDDAFGKFQQAIDAEPDSATAYIVWGKVLADQKRPDLALAKIQDGTRADPKDAGGFLALGDQLHAMHRNEDAIAAYKLAVDILPSAAAYIGWAATAIDHRGATPDEYRLANSLFARAAELDKVSARPYVVWGESLTKDELNADAVSMLKKAVERAPEDPDIRILVGDALLADKQFAAAALYYRKAIELKPESPNGYTALGRAFLGQNTNEEAIRNFTRAAELNSHSANPLFFWGLALEKQGDHDASLQKLRRAIEVQPDDPRPHYLISNIYFSLRRYAEGIDEFKKAEKLSPDMANGSQPVLEESIYNPSLDARLEIRKAISEARRAHKRLILNFGSNWCGDCQVLNLYLTDPKNKKIVDTNFVVVPIDLDGGSPNITLATSYGVPPSTEIPVLVVLDTNGDPLYVQERSEFGDMRRQDISAVTRFLTQWQVSK